MAKVAPVNLPYNVKTLWFDPNGIDIHAADKLVVQTARGEELGVAASDVTDVSDEQLADLKSALKPVLRVATEEDIEKAAELDEQGREALPVFKQLARDLGVEMHPVSVEFLLSGDKAVFYFESEDRVDFRELVRELASHFHVRVDMRQIGVRDEARIVGGLGHCGQMLCCKRLGGEFHPVSIKMAKDQDLSLNPQKISGLCGRLMCCLNYEDEAYKEFKARAPKVNAQIKTPDGEAKVVELDMPREMVSVKLEDGKVVKVPLSDMQTEGDSQRPNAIDAEAWERATEDKPLMFNVFGSMFETPKFSGNDKLATPEAIHHEHRKENKEATSSSRRSKRRSTQVHSSEQPHKQRRRSTTIKAGNKRTSDNGDALGNNESKETKTASRKVQHKGNARNAQHNEAKVRPGHRSSGLAHNDNGDGKAKKQNAHKGEIDANNANQSQANQHRRRRRRGGKKMQSGSNQRGVDNPTSSGDGGA